jgi:hypothetical protein
MCSLEVFTLDEHPAYEALSYTWDKQPPALPILVNDKVVTVSQGVDTALRHLPRADAARVLWIDALCIDQGNIYERSQKVQLMRFIYNSAAQVLVWLGSANESTNRAMQLTRSMNENREPGPFEVLRQMTEMIHVVQIFERPWFSRVWIIQEVAMAKIEPLVGCGHEWIPWSYLYNTYDTVTRTAVGDFQGQLPPFFHTLRHRNLPMLHTIREENEEASLDRYLRAISQFQATDPRDKIYSLLGLARERDRCNLVPDCDQTNPPESLYPKVVQHFVDVDGSLNILSYFRRPIEQSTDTPIKFQGYKVYSLGVVRWRPTWMPNFD